MVIAEVMRMFVNSVNTGEIKYYLASFDVLQHLVWLECKLCPGAAEDSGNGKWAEELLRGSKGLRFIFL